MEARAEQEVGRHIRAVRRARELTLEQLSERTGLSVSYLSLIENGHSSPNLRVLRGIARGLEVPMIDFLVDDWGEDICVVGIEQRRTYTLDSGASETLLYAQGRPNLEVTLMDLPPGTSSGAANSHPGEEFTFVLQGRVRVWVGGDRSFDLSAGQIIHYHSSLSHRWENPFVEPAQVLITNTPATF